MNWEAIGAVAEIVGAITVLATLIYLSVQIRSNNESTKALITQNLSDSIGTSVNMPVLNNEALHQVMLKAAKGETLSEAEQFRHTLYLHTTFRVYRAGFRQHKAGFYSEEEYAEIRGTIASMFDENVFPGTYMRTREWFEESAYGKDFKDEVEDILKSSQSEWGSLVKNRAVDT